MNQKPFDINKPVKTRSGHPVRILATDLQNDNGMGTVAYHDLTVDEIIRVFPNGLKFGPQQPSPADLINIPQRIQRTVWANLYDDEKLTSVYVSKCIADSVICINNRLACVEVKIDCAEGEGL